MPKLELAGGILVDARRAGSTTYRAGPCNCPRRGIAGTVPHLRPKEASLTCGFSSSGHDFSVCLMPSLPPLIITECRLL